jgi:hypothetical protein
MLVYAGWTHVAEPKDHNTGDLSPAGSYEIAEVEIVNQQYTLFLAG